jgi:hypothetical protein
LGITAARGSELVLPDQKGVAEVVPDGQWTIPQLTKILNSSLDKNFITD